MTGAGEERSSTDRDRSFRLFVALEIPAALREAIGEAVERERRSLPRARWVKPAGLHLTLAFLGATRAEDLPALSEALTGAFGRSEAFEMEVRGAGTFPPGRPARVAWLGLSATPPEDLIALRRRVAEACEDSLGIPKEKRPFHPHLTLARCRAPWKRPAVEPFEEAFGRAWGEAFRVISGTLFRSHLGPGGARHEVLGEYPLAVEDLR